jgi:hypothetical protein
MRIIVPNIRTVLCQAPSSSAYKSHGVSAAVFLAVEAPESEEEESESDAVHCFFYVFLFYLFFSERRNDDDEHSEQVVDVVV